MDTALLCLDQSLMVVIGTSPVAQWLDVDLNGCMSYLLTWIYWTVSIIHYLLLDNLFLVKRYCSFTSKSFLEKRGEKCEAIDLGPRFQQLKENRCRIESYSHFLIELPLLFYVACML